MLDTLKHPPIPNLCDGTCTDSCPLDAVNDMVRGIIQGARASAPVVKTGACIHRGKKIGETTCVECSAKGWRLNVLECSIHQTCTIENKGDRVAACCRTCPDYAPVAIEPIKHNEGRHRFELGNGRSTLVDAYQNGAIPIARQQNIPYERPIVRNTWQRNVAQLRQRMSLFNGRRTVAIVTGLGLDPPDAVIREFAGEVEDWIILPNDASLREVVTFVPLLERCATTAPYECTFYAHAKGVTRSIEDTNVHRWATIQYETCLDYWPLVELSLFGHPMAGSFKKIGHIFEGSRSSWHYSGTFYWLRNAAVFSRQTWHEVDQKWWGNESWPGLHFAPDEVACLFHEGLAPVLNLYSTEYRTGMVEPAYDEWKQKHARERMVVSES